MTSLEARQLLALAVFAAAGMAQAQERVGLDLDDLAPPDVPALAILGTAASEVQRPTSAKAFATTLLNNALQSEGGLVSDFAVEFAPYWWVSHPDLTFEDYNDADFPQVFSQSLSFSFGVSKVETDLSGETDGATTDDLLGGFGVSFDILRGQPSPRQREIRSRIGELASDYADRELRLQRRLLEEHGQNPEAVCTGDEDTPLCRAWRAGVDEIEDEARTEALIRAEIEQFRAEKRVGHRLELSGAVAYRLEDGNVSDREHARSSAWLTYSYIGVGKDGAASPLQLLALARWNENVLGVLGDEADSYDIGGRVIWEPTGSRIPIKASLEYLTRVSDADEADGDERFVAQIDYEINEQMSVFVSIGRNFESNLAPGLSDEDVVALVGINLAGGGAFTTQLKPEP